MATAIYYDDGSILGYEFAGGLKVDALLPLPADLQISSSPCTNRGTKKLSSLLSSSNIKSSFSSLDAIRLSRKGSNEEWDRLVASYKAEFELMGNEPVPFKERGGWIGQRVGQFQSGYLMPKGDKDVVSTPSAALVVKVGEHEFDPKHREGRTVEIVEPEPTPSWYMVKIEGSPELVLRILKDFGPLAHKCSRMDFQTTIQLHDYGDGRLPSLLYYDRQLRKKKELPLAMIGKAPTDDIILGGGNGDTFRIGAYIAKSRIKGRVYDKFKQAGEGWEGCYRYEIETHREVSQSLFSQIMLFYAQNGHFDLPREYYAGVVANYFKSKFVPVPEVDDKTPLRLFASQVKTTVERRLEWLERQVAPSLRWLLKHISISRILRALELVGHAFVPGESVVNEDVDFSDLLHVAAYRTGLRRNQAWTREESAAYRKELGTLLKLCFTQTAPLPPIDFVPLQFRTGALYS